MPPDDTSILFDTQAEILNALAHPRRLQILELLRDGEACVCHIQAMLDQRQAYVSQQMNLLRQAGLVTSRKEGLRVYYRLAEPGILELLDDLKDYLVKTARLDADGVQAALAFTRQPCECSQCTSEPALIQAG